MRSRPRFADREEAGAALAGHLMRFEHRADAVVLGLPRGGVVVAAAVAERLRLPLDVVVARKIGAPGQPELAMGALAVLGRHESVIRNERVIQACRVSAEHFDTIRDREFEVARHRAAEWGQRSAPVEGQTAILTDDGLATGATLRAAIEVLRLAGVGELVVAIPVAPAVELERIRLLVEQVECVHVPDAFGSVGAHYRDFAQVEDAAVHESLAAASRRLEGD